VLIVLHKIRGGVPSENKHSGQRASKNPICDAWRGKRGNCRKGTCSTFSHQNAQPLRLYASLTSSALVAHNSGARSASHNSSTREPSSSELLEIRKDLILCSWLTSTHKLGDRLRESSPSPDLPLSHEAKSTRSFSPLIPSHTT